MLAVEGDVFLEKLGNRLQFAEGICHDAAIELVPVLDSKYLLMYMEQGPPRCLRRLES